jgi:perosamine synthetase
MDMNKLYRAKPFFPEQDKDFILDKWKEILDTGQFIQGKYVHELERVFASYCNTKYAIATSTGATALEVSLRASGIENKKFLVPTQTFAASVSSIIRSNNIPVIIDIDPLTQCIDYDTIVKHLDDDVAGIMLVHMAGLITPEYYKIKDLCEQHNLILIEDASHAVGASIDGIKAGGLGLAGCFSLFATKIITSGEGGIITTNDYEFAEKCRIIRNHGCIRNEGMFNGIDYGVTCMYASSNYRMPEMSAVVGISQVQHIDSFVAKRNELANRYKEKITNPKIKLQYVHDNIIMTWWQYIVVIDDIDTPNDRAQLCNKLLQEYDIPTANAYWPACHEQPAFSKYLSTHGYDRSNDLLKRHIALPMYVEMSIDQVDYICKILNDIV